MRPLVGIKASCFPIVEEVSIVRALKKRRLKKEMDALVEYLEAESAARPTWPKGPWPLFTEAPPFIVPSEDTLRWNKLEQQLSEEFKKWKQTTAECPAPAG